MTNRLRDVMAHNERADREIVLFKVTDGVNVCDQDPFKGGIHLH